MRSWLAGGDVIACDILLPPSLLRSRHGVDRSRLSGPLSPVRDLSKNARQGRFAPARGSRRNRSYTLSLRRFLFVCALPGAKTENRWGRFGSGRHRVLPLSRGLTWSAKWHNAMKLFWCFSLFVGMGNRP